MVIYITTNLINGKQYIGRDSHNNPNYYGSGPAIKNAIKKYGKENFKKEIIEECSSFENLVEREEYWLNYYDAGDNPSFYNLQNSGKGVILKGEKNPMYGKRHSEQWKKKVSDKLKGRPSKLKGIPISDNHKKKISQVTAGEKNPYFKGYVVCIAGKHIGEKHITSSWSSILSISSAHIYQHLNGKKYKNGIKGNILKWENKI